MTSASCARLAHTSSVREYGVTFNVYGCVVRANDAHVDVRVSVGVRVYVRVVRATHAFVMRALFHVRYALFVLRNCARRSARTHRRELFGTRALVNRRDRGARCASAPTVLLSSLDTRRIKRCLSAALQIL